MTDAGLGSLVGLWREPSARLGLVILGVFFVAAVVGPLVLQDPHAFVAVPLQPPSATHLLGTTGQGQDVLARTVAGARVSLLLGFAVGGAVMAIGAAVGMVAGYFGGWVDDILSLLTNVFLVMPGLPLAVIIAGYLPAGPLTIALVLITTGWAWNARVLRAQTLTLRRKDFVKAAEVSGEGHLRIVFVEILPNMASLLASGFIGATVYAIGAQVGLEFLGLGDLGAVTWGTNLYWAAQNHALLTESWWTIVPTGVSIALVGFALTRINAGIDARTNPRLARSAPYRTALQRANMARFEGDTPVLPRNGEAPS